MSTERWLAALLAAALVGLAAGALLFGTSAEPPPPEPPPTPRAPPPEPPAPRPHISMEDHPNVVVVVWDTVRADRLSLYGHARATTPFLDALAAESRVYTWAASPSFWTLPAHASLFTGLPVSAHGVDNSARWLPDGYRTLAEHFREAGYDTFLFSANVFLSPHFNMVQGFDRYEHVRSPAWREPIEAYNDGKRIEADTSTRRLGKGFGHDLEKDAGPVAAEALFRWIDGRDDASVPFVAVVNYMEAHLPRRPTLASRRAILDPELLEGGLRTRADVQRNMAASRGQIEISDRAREGMLGVYDAAIRDLDHHLEGVVEGLRERNLLDGTVLVVTADHGEAFGEHGVYGHNLTLHQELTRVPLLIRYPAQLPPGRHETPVSTASIFPTLARLAGLADPGAGPDLLDLPADHVVHTELLEPYGKLARARRRTPDGALIPWTRRYRGTLRGPFTLLEASGGDKQLFRWASDPGEQRDVAAENVPMVQSLSHAHEAWRAALPAPIPQPAVPPPPTSQLEAELEALGYGDRPPVGVTGRGVTRVAAHQKSA